MRIFYTILILLCSGICISADVHAQTSSGYLRLISNDKDEYGYINSKGDTVIPFGKYIMCFTEKFKKIAFVVAKGKGLVAIDRNEKVLFHVFNFDNGPDYLSDGLFRIIENGKIGYANMDGKIIIQPQFDCAYPFKKGKAKVGKGCNTQSDGEHSWWTGGEWQVIDQKGRMVSK